MLTNTIDTSDLLPSRLSGRIQPDRPHSEAGYGTTRFCHLGAESCDFYDTASVGFLNVRRDGIIENANPAASRMLDIHRAPISEKTLMSFVEANSRRDYIAFLSRLKDAPDDHADSCEIALRRHALPPIHVQLNAVVSEDKQTFRMVMTDISKVKQLEAKREEQWLHIRQLSRRLVALQETERRTLGTELHDRTSGNLAALDLMLQDLAGLLPEPLADELATRLEDIKALLIETTSSIREISSNIRPALLDHFGFVPAIEEYASKFSKIHGIDVDLSVLTDRRFDPELESVLFRIAQEALTNCAKHSHAGTVRIALSAPDSKIVLSIIDDGYGFLPESLFTPAATPGLGILSMKERAEFAGGQFSIKSKPGKGTAIKVEFKRTKENPAWLPRKGDRRKSGEKPAD